MIALVCFAGAQQDPTALMIGVAIVAAIVGCIIGVVIGGTR